MVRDGETENIWSVSGESTNPPVLPLGKTPDLSHDSTQLSKQGGVMECIIRHTFLGLSVLLLSSRVVLTNMITL